ncbi:hypothetical protein STAS_09624 [Striga asiatica]|uniref:Uncharacterized protein n=1 Tax=Striga asiatica TaxID=4170 RepID=A0A5A7PMB3_STRAF|nr:hypothetical protein STAS_09624 [Striga asiatica]
MNFGTNFMKLVEKLDSLNSKDENKAMVGVCESQPPTLEDKLKLTQEKLKISNQNLASAVKDKVTLRNKAKKTRKLLNKTNEQLKQALAAQKADKEHYMSALENYRQELLPNLVRKHLVTPVEDFIRSQHKAVKIENEKLKSQIEDLRLENREARQEIDGLNISIELTRNDLKDSLSRSEDEVALKNHEIYLLKNLLKKSNVEFLEMKEVGKSLRKAISDEQLKYLSVIEMLREREATLVAKVEALSNPPHETIADKNEDDDDFDEEDESEYDIVSDWTSSEQTKSDENAGMWESLEVDNGGDSGSELEGNVMIKKKSKPLFGKIGSLLLRK